MAEKGRKQVHQNDLALMIAYSSLMEIEFEMVRSGKMFGATAERIQLAIRKSLPDHLYELAGKRGLDALEKKDACPDCKGKKVVGNKACGTCIACGSCRGCGWIILDLKGNTETCAKCEGTGYRNDA
jgi:hypothetical protein